MLKNNIYKIIFVTMMIICLYSLIETTEYYNIADNLQTEIALIQNDNNILRNKIEILEVDKQFLEDEIEELKDFREVLSKASYIGDFEITYYTAGVESTGKTPNHPEYGITKSGEPVKENYTASTDWTILPKGTIFYIEGVGLRVSTDEGYDIKGKRIDSYEPNLETALKNGRHMAGVYVIKWGEG